MILNNCSLNPFTYILSTIYFKYINEFKKYKYINENFIMKINLLMNINLLMKILFYL